ncbi:MAG: hypothetical protein ABH875_01355 [Candidatus Omnitrophota bacterium]
MDTGQVKRRNYFIDRKFQSDFIIRFSLIVTVASIFIGFLVLFLSKDMTTITIENSKVMVKTAVDFMLPIIIVTVILVNLIAAIAVIVLTLFTSHRISGPLFRLKREIGLLKSGDMRVNFRIRKSDQMQDLSIALTDLADSLRSRYSVLTRKSLRIEEIIKTSPTDSRAIAEGLKELKDAIGQVKV